MTPDDIQLIRRKLLRWYGREQRDLPWRRSTDPYAIWIAETMLQQTQVTTVVPYYQRFLKRLPNVRSLARAPRATVLTLWSGLGYYRRAENLHQSARRIVAEHAGRIPENFQQLRALPGIGDYTAGALLSIALGQRYPALDGNARRVFARIGGCADAAGVRHLAEAAVPRTRPGIFNQAMMDLGATICLPRAPLCGACPVVSQCRTAAGAETAGSTTRPKKIVHQLTWPLVIIRRNGRVLLRRRSPGGLLGGLWEFPGEACSRQTSAQTVKRLLIQLNAPARCSRCIGVFRHAITNRNIRAPVFLVDVAAESAIRLPAGGWRWISPSGFDRHPVAAMTRKAAGLLALHEKDRS